MSYVTEGKRALSSSVLSRCQRSRRAWIHQVHDRDGWLGARVLGVGVLGVGVPGVGVLEVGMPGVGVLEVVSGSTDVPRSAAASCDRVERDVE